VKKLWWIVLVVLSGCSAYTLVEPQRVTINDLYSVKPGIQWSQMKQGNVHLWTVDGSALESIRFISGVREGIPVVDIVNDKHETPFRADMSEPELVDAVVDALTNSGAQQVIARDLQLSPFGKLDGFRFKLDYLAEDGLRKNGDIIGVVKNDALYLVLYTGASLHYYPKFHDEFEQIVQSIEIKKVSCTNC